MMSLYRTEGAQQIGKGQIFPHNSIADPELKSMLMGYRRVVAHGYRSLLPDEINTMAAGPMHASPKIDGELWFLVAEKDQLFFASPQGRVITGDLPIMEEARRFAGKCKGRTILAGELFARRDEGRCRVGDVAHAMAGGSEAHVDKLCFAAFDLASGGDAEGSMPLGTYAEKLDALNRIVDGKKHVSVVETRSVTKPTEVAELFTSWVESGRYEGLVVRTLGRTCKIKPTFLIDAAIIGYTEKEDDKSQVRSLALALMRQDGKLQYVAACGNMPEPTRKELMELLKGSETSSNWKHASSDGAIYRFVHPRHVMEVKVTDIQSEDSTGSPILRMVLSYGQESGYQAVRKLPCATLLYPIFSRLRADKEINEADIRIDQVLERTYVPDTDARAETVELSASAAVRREVYTKGSKGSIAVRKLLVYKTNKEKADPSYPAFVVHFTDYSPSRKDPLQREVRLAPDEATAMSIAEEMLAENIKKGWKKTG